MQFEANNSTICDLGLLQTFILGLDIGLWSGNRRKMEIAECHLLIPITVSDVLWARPTACRSSG